MDSVAIFKMAMKASYGQLLPRALYPKFTGITIEPFV